MTEVAKFLLGWLALSIVAAPLIGRALKRAGESTRVYTYGDGVAAATAVQFAQCTRDDCVPESDGTPAGHLHAEVS